MPWPRALITFLGRFWGVIPVVLALGLFAVRAVLHTEPLERLVAVAADPSDPPGEIARAGSIAIARGGPVIIGFVTDKLARLTVAGREIRGKGPVTQRIVVPAGATAVRFAGPPEARLVWSPVGRRGDPEYVGASSLSPEPPERATFDRPGTATLDGVTAFGLLVILVGTLLMLVRRRLAVVPRTTWIAMASVLALAMIVRLIDLGGAGQTWDEDVNWAAGRNYITNLMRLDFSAPAWQSNFEHPPVMKLLAGMGAQLADGFGPARALSALWVALGCALLVPIGARLYRLRVGVLAGVIAALLPSLVAHGQIVGHEAPTVLWWSLGILLALGVHDDLSAERLTAQRTLAIRIASVGAVVGIAIASRFINGLLGVLCALILVMQAPPTSRRMTLAVGAAVMPAVAVLAFYSVWPRMWPHPAAVLLGPVCAGLLVWWASRPDRAIWQGAVLAAALAATVVIAFPHARHALAVSFKRLSLPHATEPFLGAITNEPGPHYFVAYLVATLPIGILLGLVAWVARVGVERTSRRAAILLGVWLVIPLAVVASPVRQDGVRYVMPSVLALVMMSAAGIEFVAATVERRLRHVFVGLGLALAAYLGITLVRAHPYYLDYFGEHVGGAGMVAERRWFETAWWGEGLDRAIGYVNASAASGSRVHRGCVLPSHLTWFREDLWAPMVTEERDAEWIVVYAPMTSPCRMGPGANKVFEVVADGAVLAEVYWRK